MGGECRTHGEVDMGVQGFGQKEMNRRYLADLSL